MLVYQRVTTDLGSGLSSKLFRVNLFSRDQKVSTDTMFKRI